MMIETYQTSLLSLSSIFTVPKTLFIFKIEIKSKINWIENSTAQHCQEFLKYENENENENKNKNEMKTETKKK